MKLKVLTVGPIQANCYILCDEVEKICAVIDAGGDAPAIADAVRSTGCTPCAIMLTHGHYDHTGGVADLQQLWGDIPVYLNVRDLRQGEFMQRPFLPLKNTVSYDEGDVISVGSLQVKVYATPGHSEGSVTLECGDCLFTGDTLFAGSCGRTDLPTGSLVKMFGSLRRLAKMEGEFHVYPGHMESTLLSLERRTNPYVLHALSR